MSEQGPEFRASSECQGWEQEWVGIWPVCLWFGIEHRSGLACSRKAWDSCLAPFLSVAGQLRCSQDYEMPQGWVGIKEILTWANLLNLAKNNWTRRPFPKELGERRILWGSLSVRSLCRGRARDVKSGSRGTHSLLARECWEHYSCKAGN